jgi:CcmD family protein
VFALQQPPAATDEFVPVKDLPAQEQLPAAPLLVTAYAFVWLVVLVYVIFLWQRIGRVERDLRSMAHQLDEKRRS